MPGQSGKVESYSFNAPAELRKFDKGKVERPGRYPVHFRARVFLTLAAALAITLISVKLSEGQTTATKAGAPKAAEPSKGAPKFKAIFEPINYKQDLNLTDVLFVSEKSGWIAGAKGTILHTEDGGDTWTAQLGGDPQSPAGDMCCLEFLDATHGWVFQGTTLLRTTDGQTWEPVADDAVRHYFWTGKGYHFFSATNGIDVYGDKISVTQDGGRTWKQVFTCHAAMEVDGLTRDQGCTLAVLSFPSANVGYAALDPRIIMKTEDGGATWNALVGPEEPGDQRVYGLTFLDERNGFAARAGAKLYRTEDGGQSWHGVVATPGITITFSGRNVGWSFRGKLLTYTTDGGVRWTSREIPFPADVNNLSLPTPQRAYVVGDHGMIYRYRIVPIEYSVKGMLAAPAMSPP